MRQGQFSRTSHSFGASLDIVKSVNNDPGSTVPQELLDAALKLTLSQQSELSRDISDLFNLYKAERDIL